MTLQGTSMESRPSLRGARSSIMRTKRPRNLHYGSRFLQRSQTIKRPTAGTKIVRRKSNVLACQRHRPNDFMSSLMSSISIAAPSMQATTNAPTNGLRRNDLPVIAIATKVSARPITTCRISLSMGTYSARRIFSD